MWWQISYVALICCEMSFDKIARVNINQTTIIREIVYLDDKGLNSLSIGNIYDTIDWNWRQTQRHPVSTAIRKRNLWQQQKHILLNHYQIIILHLLGKIELSQNYIKTDFKSKIFKFLRMVRCGQKHTAKDGNVLLVIGENNLLLVNYCWVFDN